MNSSRRTSKKFFTVAEANATLPLLRSILRDITDLAHQIKERKIHLSRLRDDSDHSLGDAYNEEMEQIEAAFHNDQDKMEEYEQELRSLGVQLKDYFTGLVDFPHIREGREVYLCWQFGEPQVSHWHELDAGFAGRQKLVENMART